jgi:hypothetical protein
MNVVMNVADAKGIVLSLSVPHSLQARVSSVVEHKKLRNTENLFRSTAKKVHVEFVK